MTESSEFRQENQLLDHSVFKYFQSLKACLKQHSSGDAQNSCDCKNQLDNIRLSISSIEHCYLQDMIWSSEECVSSLKSCMEMIFPCAIEPSISAKLPNEKEDLANAFVTCIANLTAANGKAVGKLFTAFDYHSIYGILKICPVMVAQKWCAVIHAILLQDSLARPFLDAVPTYELVSELCQVYSDESQYACFALFCLEHILSKYSDHQILNDVWFHLDDVNQLLVLSVCQAVIASGTSQKRNILASEDSLKFLCNLYCCECKAVLTNNQDHLEKCNPHVLREVCATMLCASTALPHRDYLRAHASATLLPTSIRFLKVLNLATFRPSDAACQDSAAGPWMCKNLIPESAGIGLRCDLVQLIGNLVNDHRQNQDVLCSLDGLEEIFCSCRRDEGNPLIQEAVIFALSCSLKGNPENVEHLKNKLANREDGRNSALMERLGLKPDEFLQVPPQT